MRNVATNKSENVVKRLSVSTIALILVSVMIFGCAVGGTLAWLTKLSDKTVKNVFVLGDIVLTLDQEGAQDAGQGIFTKKHENFLEGGTNVTVNPRISISMGSIKSYIFVSITESASFTDAGEYEIADGWVELEDKITTTDGYTTRVFYRLFTKTDLGENDIVILKNDTVSSKKNFGSNVVYGKGEEEPQTTLEFKAYAIQYTGVTAEVEGVVPETPTQTDINTAWDYVKAYADSQS